MSELGERIHRILEQELPRATIIRQEIDTPPLSTSTVATTMVELVKKWLLLTIAEKAGYDLQHITQAAVTAVVHLFEHKAQYPDKVAEVLCDKAWRYLQGDRTTFRCSSPQQCSYRNNLGACDLIGPRKPR